MSATFDFAADAATHEPQAGKATLADGKLGTGRARASGERMARKVENFDWRSTPLGPIEHWPAELKTLARHVLESQFPKAIAWGPELTTIYNDAFRPILGEKPEALGRPFSHVWSEVWADIGPIAERALAGEATFIEDHPLIINRSGEPEKAWFTFCYSPVRLADGSIRGMLDTVIETTATVRAREDLVLINKELGHRLKNTLALVHSITLQTLQGTVREVPKVRFKNASQLSAAHTTCCCSRTGLQFPSRTRFGRPSDLSTASARSAPRTDLQSDQHQR